MTNAKMMRGFLCRIGSRRIGLALLIALALCGRCTQVAAEDTTAVVDLSAAVVVTPADLSGPEQKAVDMLLDEVEKRTFMRWAVQHEWSTEASSVVAVGPASSFPTFAKPVAAELGTEADKAAEGYRLKVTRAGQTAAVLVAGNDARGVLFGVGRLLRELRMSRGSVRLASDLDIQTAPRCSMRGHQLGYRPKVNTYDGWTVGMFEQYIRDLAVFGTNAIEVIPPRSDDAADSPHFTLPPIDMMAAVSQLAADYGIDFWIWYPAMDPDYSDP